MDKAITSRDEQSSTQESTQNSQNTPAAPFDGPSPSQGKVRERIWALLTALRPRQWTKNLAVFVGLVFAQRLLSLTLFERTILAFIVFCLVSSSIYLFNDLLDLEQDREHPTKRNRPLASGRLPIAWANTAMGFLFLACGALLLLLLALPIPPRQDIYSMFGGANALFTFTVVAYLFLMVLYNTRFKHVVLIDVFLIASGFVLRILAGALVISVSISPWLYLVTCFLSLFLALAKRRNELLLLQGQAAQHRAILKEYSVPMLDQMITIVVGATILAYSLYTIQGPLESRRLIITIPFVVYGIFRYLYLVHIHMEGGSPEEVLLRDRPMLGTVIVCTALILTVLYLLPQ